MIQNNKQTYWCRCIDISSVLAGVSPCRRMTINAVFYAMRQDEKTIRHHIAAKKPKDFGNRGQCKPIINRGDGQW